MSLLSFVRGVLIGAVGLLVLVVSPATGHPLSPSPSLSQDTSDRDRRYAQQLFVRGMTEAYLEDYEEAISYFENALDLVPNEPSILMALADAQAQQENYTSALFYARQANDHGRSHPYYARRLAELQQEAGHKQEAVETYQTVLSNFPRDLKTHLALARLQADLEEPEAALEVYETLLEEQQQAAPKVYLEMLPLYRQVGDEEGLETTLESLIQLRVNDTLYRRLLGQLYTEQDRLDEAISLFESLLKEQPEDADVVSRLTLLYQQTDQDDEARLLLENMGSSDTTSAAHQVQKAESMYHNATTDPAAPDSGLVQTAIDLLEEALEQSPSHLEALDLLGTIHFEQGRYEEAVRPLTRALDEDPRSEERWWRAAAALLNSNTLEEAAEVAEEGLLLFPGHHRLARTAAFARLRLHEDEAALEHFQNALDLQGDDPSLDRDRAALYAGIGVAHGRQGNTQQSHEAYEQALDIHPHQPMALQNYAYSLAEHDRDLDRALSLAQRLVERNPTNPSYLDTLGWVYLQRDDLQKAKTYFEEALETGNAPAIVYQHVGDVHEALGNEASAQQYWNEALERAPNPDALRHNLGVEVNN